MKNSLKRWLTVLAALIVCFSFIGCMAPEGGKGYAGPAIPDSMGDERDETSDETDDKDSVDLQRPVKKQLTAAEWNDLKNYEYWQSLFAASRAQESNGQNEGQEPAREGIFHRYENDRKGLDTRFMREIEVITADGAKAAGAKVYLLGGEAVLFEAVTDASGKAFVFGENATDVQAESGRYAAKVPLAETGITRIALAGQDEKPNEIEIMFVVDTTGSMGDELSYLKKEFTGVIRRVRTASDAAIKVGLVFYRDYDEPKRSYLSRPFDFADVSDESGLLAVLGNINAQSTDGGGDYPEAVEHALDTAVRMQWSSGASTKLLFHVLDAPYHDTAQYQDTFAAAVRTAAGKGIRIIPVAASGLDTLGQYIMRSAAMLTGGTYAFLTDDSGIGDSHEEPEVGGYTVEYLSDLLVRLTVGYHTGKMALPVHWTQSPEY